MLYSGEKGNRKREVHSILYGKLQYYEWLSTKGRNKFIDRVLKFQESKRFVGMDGLEIDFEVKVLISAAAVQLTFGFKQYLLSHYHTIYIYPEHFYSDEIGAKLKGGATPDGTLSFSWPDFKHGYAIPDDRYNLGLHEMAHALKIHVMKGAKFDQRFKFYLEHWLNISHKEYSRIKRGTPSFLRGYAGENKHEFFAVCVEHFFEKPDAMQEELPDVFNHLVVLLNQDPTNSRGDYKITGEFYRKVNQDPATKPVPNLAKSRGGAGGMSDSFDVPLSPDQKAGVRFVKTLFLLGFFVAPFLLVANGAKLVMGVEWLLAMIAGVGMIGFIVFYSWLIRGLDLLTKWQYFFFSLIGLGLNCVAVILLLNSLLYWEEYREVGKVERVASLKGGGFKLYFKSVGEQPLSLNELEQDHVLSTNAEKKPFYVTYPVRTGLFGLKTMGEVKYVEPQEGSAVKQD